MKKIRDSIWIMYGGTFDPFHLGHLEMACAARDQFDCEVHITPAADPPHRGVTGANAEMRVEMISQSIGSQKNLRLDLRELQRDGPSYSVDTLAQIRDEIGALKPLAILMGADSFLSIPSWHHWSGLIKLAHWIVLDRPGNTISNALPTPLQAIWNAHHTTEKNALKRTASGLIYRIEDMDNPISARHIRTRIMAKDPSWCEDVTPEVAQYIEENGLYQAK